VVQVGAINATIFVAHSSLPQLLLSAASHNQCVCVPKHQAEWSVV